MSFDPLLSPNYGTLHERVLSPRYRWSCRDRGEVPFVIVQAGESGSGYFDPGSGRIEVPPHHAFLGIVPENALYGYPDSAREPWVFSWLNLYGQLAIDLCTAFREEFGYVVPLPEEAGLGERFREIVRAAASQERPNPFRRSADTYAFLMEWWAHLRTPRFAAADAVWDLREHIERRYYEQENIKALAARYGLSREHLTRMFIQEVGQSPAAYLRARRAGAAAALLKNTALPLTEVALRCGFVDVRQLTRAVVSVLGRTPQRIRMEPGKQMARASKPRRGAGG